MVKVPVAPIFIDTFTSIACSGTAGEEFPVGDDPPLADDPLFADELSVIELAIDPSVIELAFASPAGTFIATRVGNALMVCPSRIVRYLSRASLATFQSDNSSAARRCRRLSHESYGRAGRFL